MQENKQTIRCHLFANVKTDRLLLLRQFELRVVLQEL